MLKVDFKYFSFFRRSTMVITKEINDKMHQYVTEVMDAEKEGDYDKVNQKIQDYLTFINATRMQEKDPAELNHLFTLDQMLKMFRRIVKLRKESEENFAEVNARLDTIEGDLDVLDRRIEGKEKDR